MTEKEKFEHPFAQDKERWYGKTVFHIDGVRFVTVVDANIVLKKEASKPKGD